MTQRNRLSPTLEKIVWQRVFLLQGLGWMVGLGVLSGGISVAQTQTEAETPAAAPVEQNTPAIIDAPAPVAPETQSLPEFSAPVDAAPAAPSAPQSVTVPVDGGDLFIDRTDYNLGATQREVPGEVTRRSLANLGGSEQIPTSVAPVQVGPISLSSSGIRWNPETPGNTTAIGREYNTVRNYYNRTVRPQVRLGNNNLRLIFPLAIPAAITSVFGWRIHPITGTQRFHAGTDIGAPMGTPVVAAYTGQVILADFFGGYGLAVALSHTQNTQQTLYAHLSEIFVKPGELVQQGTVIGRVGSTGASTGPHLHFEFRQLTTEGWVAMDAGTELETSLAQLVKAFQVAQAPPKPGK